MSKSTTPDLADIPHAPDTDPDTLDVLETILVDDHVGENNAITSDALAAAVGEHSSHDTNPAIRDAVRDLLFDRGVPVASCNTGYYIPADEGDIADEMESIRNRIGELNKRKLAFEAATEGWDFEAHTSTPDEGGCEKCDGPIQGDPYLWHSVELCRDCFDSRPPTERAFREWVGGEIDG